MFDEQESGLFSNKGLLKYEQAISLQTICAVNIVANLWKNEKVELENKFYEFGSEIKHRDIIFSKINRLHLPRVITGHLVSVIEFVGNALKSWIEFHDKYLFDYDPGMDDSETDYNEDYMDNSKVEFDDDDHMYDLETKKRRDSQSTKYLNLIKFTNNGTIDQMQTAKNILINETNLELKYKLASHYCLEEEIQNIPAAIKNDFCKRFVEEFCMSDDLDLDENPVLFYWTYHTVSDNRHLYEVMMTDNYDGKSLNEYVIDAVLDNEEESLYYEVAIKYLWNKLTDTEKSNEKIIDVIERLETPDLKYSFISTLDYKQQQIIFKDISFSFLKNMLNDLTWRYRFVSTICHVFDMLDEHIYYKLLCELVDQIKYDTDVNDKFCNLQCYRGIFKTFWKQTPFSFKEYVFKQKRGEQIIVLLSELNWDINFDLILIVLADMPVTHKKNAIYSQAGVHACVNFIVEEKWESLDLFIKSFLLTDENQVDFKEHIISKSVIKVCFQHFQQKNFDKITYFLKWAFKSDEAIAEFKKSVKLINKTTFCYDICFSQNVASKHTWYFAHEQCLQNFERFFLQENMNIY